MAEGFYLERADVEKLKRQGALAEQAAARPVLPAQQQTARDLWVKITSTTKTGDYYPAIWYTRNEADSEWTTGEACYAKDANDGTLAADLYYRAALTGIDEGTGRAVFFTFQVEDGITVEEVDGVPTYANRTTLRFDQADGFVVSQPAAGIARVDISAASTSQAGIVSTTTQEFAGRKSFNQGALIWDQNVLYFGLPDSSNAYSQLQEVNDKLTLITFHDDSDDSYIMVTLIPESVSDEAGNAEFRLECWFAGAQQTVCYSVKDAVGDVKKGGTATTGGLTFVGGLYISGTISGSGITSLGGQSGASQTFADVDDTNVTLAISSAADVHTFTMGWSGTLAVARGGSGRADATAYAVICGGTTSTGAHQSVSGLGTAGQVLTSAGAGALPTWQDAPTAGDVSGPATSTANAIARWDGTGGDTLKDSSITIDDSGNVDVANAILFGLTVPGGGANGLRLLDASSDHVLTLAFQEELTADRQLTIVVNNASRTLNLGGNLTTSAAVTISAFGASIVDDANGPAVLTTLGGTTVGQSFFTTANPSAIRFPRVNADNTVSYLSDSDFRTAIGISGGVVDGDYGDITVSGSGATWTIDNDVVSNAKLANMAEATFKMRAAGAGTGDPIDGTATQARTALGLATGDSPQFAAVNIGDAADTTITRVGAGAIAVEGNTILVSGGALGTPASATLTNATGLPISTGVSGLASGIAAWLADPTSAKLATAVTDETGSGSLVFATSPTLVTPALGTPSAIVLTNASGFPNETYGSGSLSSSHNITSANGTWEEVAASITLPAAGEYNLWSRYRLALNFATGTAGQMDFKLRNTTDNADISGTVQIGFYWTVSAQLIQMSGAILPQPYVADGADTIKLFVKSEQATTWNTRQVTGTGDFTTVYYQKIGP